MGLSDYPIGTGIGVTDIEPARRFYGEALGLEVLTDAGDNITYRCGGGTNLYVFASPHAGHAKTTLAGWEVTDIEGVVAELRDRGVEFLDVHEEGIDTDEQGIAHFEGDAKVAYFTDPDGNVLSLGQAPSEEAGA